MFVLPFFARSLDGLKKFNYNFTWRLPFDFAVQISAGFRLSAHMRFLVVPVVPNEELEIRNAIQPCRRLDRI